MDADGPAEIIWQGNEIIVRKRRVKVLADPPASLQVLILTDLEKVAMRHSESAHPIEFQEVWVSVSRLETLSCARH